MNRRRNVAKKQRNSTESLLSESASHNSITKKTITIKKRKDNSLVELTKNFLNYIKKESPIDNTIQISKMVKKLKVKKRRIYDITNVLEGIGYIKKLEKNKLKLLDNRLNYTDLGKGKPDKKEDLSNETQRKSKELESLEKKEADLEEWHNNLKLSLEKMTEDKEFIEHAYITYDDLKKLSTKEDMNYIAVKAQKGTIIEIPDPENVTKLYNQTINNLGSDKEKFDQIILDCLEKKFQVLFDSPNGDISVYLVTNNNLNNDEKSSFQNDFYNTFSSNNNFNVPKTKHQSNCHK